MCKQSRKRSSDSASRQGVEASGSLQFETSNEGLFFDFRVERVFDSRRNRKKQLAINIARIVHLRA
jgi:hypothetical protein